MSKHSHVATMRERVAQTVQIRKDKRKSNLAQRRQACLGATQQEESSTIRDVAQLTEALPGSAKELSFILRNPQVAFNFVKQGGFNVLCSFFGDLDVLTCLAYITYSDTCLDLLVKTNKQDLYVLASKTALLVATVLAVALLVVNRLLRLLHHDAAGQEVGAEALQALHALAQQGLGAGPGVQLMKDDLQGKGHEVAPWW
jgi:hypothetical protein